MKKPIARLGVSLAFGLGLALAVLVLAHSQVPLAQASGPWFVATTGNDSHDCLSSGTACLTIGAAVGKAASGDVIQIAAGAYTENVSISGKALTFVGAGLASTVVDGGGADRVFDSDSDLTLSDLTLQSGFASAGDGGGLHTTGAVTLTSVAIYSSTAFFNGGAVDAGGPALFTGSLFQNNSGANGGGVYVANSLTLSSSNFISNTTLNNASPGWGGGARALLAMTVSGGQFQGNSADSGGGLYADAGLTLAGTQFVSNTAVNLAGGAYLSDTSSLADAVFSGNSASSAGGAEFNASAAVSGTIFFSNTAATGGGGAYFNGVATLTNTDFSQNLNISATSGGGGGAVFGASASLSGGSFVGNVSSFAGGGAYFSLPASLTGTTFSGNLAANNRGGGAYFNDQANIVGGSFTANHTPLDRGAGAYFRLGAVVSGTQFISNVSGNRGGGALFFGTATLTQTAFLNNTAANKGGGAYFNTAYQLFDSSFISNTSADSGGALFSTGSPGGSIINGLFTRNQAAVAGADLLLDNSSLTFLVNTTLANASPNPGAAVVSDNGTLAVTNTLFANYSAGLVLTGSGAAVSDYNLFYNAPTNAITGSHSLTATDPLFINSAADNYRLGAGSPASGAGTNAGVTTDLDGAPRGTPPSIGAYELPAYQLTVSTAGTGLGTVSVAPSQTVYAQGTVVTLTALPTGGSSFAAWSGALVSLANPLSLTMTSNKSLTATFNAPAADLRLSVRGVPSQAVPGALLTYTVVLTNTGPAVASTVRLTDTLSTSSSFQALSSPGGWSCQSPSIGSSGVVACASASLAAGAPATFTITVQLELGLAPSTTITNTATATSATADPTTPNTASSTTQVVAYRTYFPVAQR